MVLHPPCLKSGILAAVGKADQLLVAVRGGVYHRLGQNVDIGHRDGPHLAGRFDDPARRCGMRSNCTTGRPTGPAQTPSAARAVPCGHRAQPVWPHLGDLFAQPERLQGLVDLLQRFHACAAFTAEPCPGVPGGRRPPARSFRHRSWPAPQPAPPKHGPCRRAWRPLSLPSLQGAATTFAQRNMDRQEALGQQE